jgi:hypothetical protein
MASDRANRDGAGVIGIPGLHQLLRSPGNSQGASKIIRRAERQDRNGYAAIGNSGQHLADCAVAAGNHDQVDVLLQPIGEIAIFHRQVSNVVAGELQGCFDAIAIVALGPGVGIMAEERPCHRATTAMNGAEFRRPARIGPRGISATPGFQPQATLVMTAIGSNR